MGDKSVSGSGSIDKSQWRRQSSIAGSDSQSGAAKLADVKPEKGNVTRRHSDSSGQISSPPKGNHAQVVFNIANAIVDHDSSSEAGSVFSEIAALESFGDDRSDISELTEPQLYNEETTSKSAGEPSKASSAAVNSPEPKLEKPVDNSLRLTPGNYVPEPATEQGGINQVSAPFGSRQQSVPGAFPQGNNAQTRQADDSGDEDSFFGEDESQHSDSVSGDDESSNLIHATLVEEPNEPNESVLEATELPEELTRLEKELSSVKRDASNEVAKVRRDASKQIAEVRREAAQDKNKLKKEKKQLARKAKLEITKANKAANEAEKKANAAENKAQKANAALEQANARIAELERLLALQS